MGESAETEMRLRKQVRPLPYCHDEDEDMKRKTNENGSKLEMLNRRNDGEHGKTEKTQR